MNQREIREQKLEELRLLRERQRARKPETLREFTETEEARAREEAERPVREAEAALNATHRQLADYALEQVSNGRPDPGFELPASVSGKRMTVAEADEFNAAEARKFRKNNPEFYASPANLKKLVEYIFERQGVRIVDEATYRAAFERLQYLGLLEERPEPETTPEPIPVVEVPREEPKQDDGSMEGFDPETGQPRRYSAFEIERMSAETFRRTFRLKPADLVLARRL